MAIKNNDVLISQLDRINARLQIQLKTLNHKSIGLGGPTPVVWWWPQGLIDTAYQILDSQPSPTPQAVKESALNVHQSIQDLGVAVLTLQDQVDIGEADRIGQAISPQLIRLRKSTLPAEVDLADETSQAIISSIHPAPEKLPNEVDRAVDKSIHPAPEKLPNEVDRADETSIQESNGAMANEEAILLSKYGRLKSRLQSQLSALNLLLESRGVPTVEWTVRIKYACALIKSANKTVGNVKYPLSHAVELIIQTIDEMVQDLDHARLSLQNIINIGDANRAGDQIISQLTQLKNSIPADTDQTDLRGLFND